MRVKQLFTSLTLGLGLTLALLWLLGGATLPVAQAGPSQCPGQRPLLQVGDVITVCLSGGCDYASIQAAVDAASSGDEILVATGTYTGVSARTGVTQVVYISKTVTIRGGYATNNWATSDPVANPTTLDAQGQGRVLYITGDISPTVEGLRITGGNAEWRGGGVYVITATATLSNNQVFSNTSYNGGGLYLRSSDATLISNTFTDNAAGGMLGYGGGLSLLASDATLISNTFTANATGELGLGGGLCLWLSAATLNSNTFISNTAHVGGGLVLGFSDATLHGNTISYNIADYCGGLGLCVSNATLVNNLVADNRTHSQGSGLGIYGSSLGLLHTTIAHNTGGDGNGMYVTSYIDWQGTTPTTYYSTVALTNTILVSHSVGISVTSGNTVTVNGVLWYGTPVTVSQATTVTVTVQNQHQGDPAFAADGYHLTASSAAIDRGVNAGVATDIDGQSRDAIPDLGADEFVGVTPIYLPLIMRQYQ